MKITLSLPLDERPEGVLSREERRALLDGALWGVALGEYDEWTVNWLAGWDAPTVATLASLIVRARAAEAVRR